MEVTSIWNPRHILVLIAAAFEFSLVRTPVLAVY